MCPSLSADRPGRAAPARDSLATPEPGVGDLRGGRTATGRPQPPRAPFRFQRTAAIVGIVALAVLFVSPGSFATPFSGSSMPAAAPHAVPGHLLAPAPRSIAPSHPTATAQLPGSDPTKGSAIDSPDMAATVLTYRTLHATNSTAVAPLAPATPRAPQAAPLAVSTGCPATTFSGYVYNYSGFALSGVSVQAYSVNQCVCPQSTCPSVSTTANGSFSAKGPVGADYLTFILSGYLENISYATGVQGANSNIGTIYLVAEAFATGTVEANTSKHSGVSGVTVKAISRDLQLVGNPSAVTGSNGYFKVAVPPVPSQIQFSPPYGYLPTYVDLNATPGQTINLGVIYLDKEPTVTATLYDAVTGQLVPQGNCNPFDTSHCHAMWVCSGLSNACLNQGPSVGTDTLQALGPLGYDFLQVEAVGYLENKVPIGLVNTSTFNAGKIYMVPLGIIDQVTTVTANATRLPFGTGLWWTQVCSMNGYFTGFGVVNPTTYTVNMSASHCVSGGCKGPSLAQIPEYGFPLRNDVVVQPDTTAVCGLTPTWPIPGLLPVWSNETYVNATPRMTTGPVFLNLTPGDYVYGNVTVQGTTKAPTGGFSVSGVSTDNPTIASYSYTSGDSSSPPSPWLCAPYPRATDSFCAPVPAGPGEIRVQSLSQSYEQNFTWGSVPYMCCYSGVDPMPLNRYTQGPPLAGTSTPTVGVTTLNLTAEGGVYGRVFRGHTNLGVFFGSVQVSPAGTNPLQPSFDGPIFINGSFFTQSAAGWVSVTASASGYSPDTVWAFVSSNNTGIPGNVSVGNISLTPLATLSGQVQDPTGHGIYDASVFYCPIANPTTCTALGAGLSTSNGVFNGTVTGGWLPWTTYMVKATSSGYTSDWTWVNATAGQSTLVPTLTLYPVGTNTTASPRPQGGSVAAGVWVDGYLRDQLLDWGVVTNSIQACPLSGLSCDNFNISNQDGYFNDSVLPGSYNLVVTPLGYEPVTIYFNATQAAVIHLGNIVMTELPWVTGYANITPFGEISVKNGASWVQILLAPGATAFACNNNGSVCGPSLVISSQGAFTVMTGGGNYNKIEIIPDGSTVATSINGGFTTNTTIFNSTTEVTNLSAPLELEVYTIVSGYVNDATEVGPGGIVPWLPVRWAPVSVSTFGPSHASAAWTTNGGGWYAFFLPPGPNSTFVTAGGAPEADVPANATSTVHLLSENPPLVYQLPTLNLTHFGWVVARVSASPNGSAAGYIGVSATLNSAINGTLSGNSITNGGGYLNVTAPPGHPVLVQVGPGSDYNGTNFTVWVNASQTTFKNGSQFWGLGNESVNPWGWIRSTSLNNSTNNEVPTVVDSVNGLPVPLATVTVSSTSGLSGTSPITNWNGEFLADAPISGKDSLTITHQAFVQNVTTHVIKPGENLAVREINLTGVGVLAGTVIGYPGNERIPFATISACPYNSTGFASCFSATANATGVFWIAAVPGLVSVTASANGFVTNKGTVARSCSDCWNWLQPIVLDEFSYVIGTVRGLPSGLPLNNATVSVCSTLGHPVGACGFETVTPVTGSFELAVPAGQYILQANHTGYNSSYLPIGLVPGEILPVGIIFLKQFGTIYGQVLSSATLLPVFNASVIACADWSGGACAPAVTTDVLGHFVDAAAPGPYTLAILAAGFQDGYAAASFKAGVTSTIPPILIQPLGVDTSYVVSGKVVNGSNPAQGIGGATVAALVGGSVVFSTQSLASGGFSMTVLYGVYTLQVTASGYHPVTQGITVHGPVTGLLFPLSVMTYNVTGTVTDGLTHQVLSGVAIAENGIVSAVSDVNGQFALALANGTHQLVASYEGASGAAYSPLPFAVTVNGVDQVHDLQLIPPSIAIAGTVVDAYAGTPLPGAALTVQGTTSDGVPVRQALIADAAGGFTVTLPLGSYNVTATFTGYHTVTIDFEVTTAGASLAVPMSPVSAVSVQPPAASGNGALYVLIGAVVLIVVALAALAWLLTAASRRKSAPRAAPARAPAPRPPLGGK